MQLHNKNYGEVSHLDTRGNVSFVYCYCIISIYCLIISYNSKKY